MAFLAASRSTTDKRIMSILQVRSQLKVIGIATPWIIAAMQDERTFGNQSMHQRPHDPMNQQCLRRAAKNSGADLPIT
jgi:hypothetical protein